METQDVLLKLDDEEAVGQLVAKEGPIWTLRRYEISVDITSGHYLVDQSDAVVVEVPESAIIGEVMFARFFKRPLEIPSVAKLVVKL
jgi:hypothetical protein